MIHDENNVLTDYELVIVRDFLRISKYGCLYIRNEHPRGFKKLDYSYNKDGQSRKTSHKIS